MPRYKLTLEYDGRPFVGWQRQDNGPSVQATLEDAIFRYSGETVAVHAAGRTDAGVHALGQVVHVDIARGDPAMKVQNALNALVRPAPVAVVAAEEVPKDFHARFSCLGRSYVYRILNRRSQPVLEAGRVWWVARALDHEAMTEAAVHLIGHHDFSSFRAAECQANSPMRTLDTLQIVRVGDIIEVHAAAKSFLHHQVRNMVGTLELVGAGRWQPARMAEALAARSRSAAGPTCPPDGLFFKAALYP